MAAVEELPAEPMEIVDTIDDLDGLLSTADNLAEALEFKAVKVKNRKNSTHESNADNCVMKSDRNKTNTANEKNQSIVPDVQPTNGLADGIVHPNNENEPVIETIDLDDDDEVDSSGNSEINENEAVKVQNGNFLSSEDSSGEHMGGIEDSAPSEDVAKETAVSDAPHQTQVESEQHKEENIDITNISSETENQETINLDSDIEEMELENVKCDRKGETTKSSDGDAVAIDENDTKECSVEESKLEKETENAHCTSHSGEADEKLLKENPSPVKVAGNDPEPEVAKLICNDQMKEDSEINCAKESIEIIDLELETIDLDSETEKEERTKPEIKPANRESKDSKCETAIKAEEIPPDIEKSKTSSSEPEAQSERNCQEMEDEGKHEVQDIEEPCSGDEKEEKSKRSEIVIEETINLDSDTESQLGDENMEGMATISTEKDTNAKLHAPDTTELQHEAPESEDLELAPTGMEISEKPIDECGDKKSEEDEIPDVIETGLEVIVAELEKIERDPEVRKHSEVAPLEIHSLEAEENAVEMLVEPVDIQRESVEKKQKSVEKKKEESLDRQGESPEKKEKSIETHGKSVDTQDVKQEESESIETEIETAAAEKDSDNSATEQFLIEATVKSVNIEVNLVESDSGAIEAKVEAVKIELNLVEEDEGEIEIMENLVEKEMVEEVINLIKEVDEKPVPKSSDPDVSEVKLDPVIILDENDKLKVDADDSEEQLESVGAQSTSIEINSELQPIESYVKSLECEIPTASEGTTPSKNQLSVECDIQEELECMEIDLINPPMSESHTETDPIKLKTPIAAEEETIATITATEINEELNNVLPVSPRIIELLDDDDEDTEPPPKRFAVEPTKETHISDRMQPGPSNYTKLETNDDRKHESTQDTVPETITTVETKESEEVKQVDDKIELESLSDGSDECVFYGKECINFECERKSPKKFYKAPGFILNFYKTQRKNKLLFVCNDCFDSACAKYKDLVGALVEKKPLLKQDIPKRQDFVEILDSSDEDEDPGEVKMDDEEHLNADSIELLRNELDSAICDIIKRIDLNKQVEWSKKILSDKLGKMEVECQEISDNLKQLQKSADTMHSALYQCPKIKIKELPALDLNTGRPYSCESEYTVPPLGELKYPAIEINSTYYAVRNKAIASWLPCRVIESMDVSISGQKSVKYFKVKYLKIKVPTIKCVSAKHMAYGDAPNVRLSIGTRIIALFDGSTLSKNNKEVIAPNAFYPGIIAEQLQAYNKYRYLIFFDDGYAQYVHHKDVRVVCQAAENVWEDVHPASRDFIHNYLSQYQKHRPMVQVKKGQSMITESNGKWLYAKVVDVDASLVQMQFEGQNRYEWIYRGSTRLGPLFKEKQSNGTAAQPASFPRRTEPYVRYDEEAIRNDAVQQQAVVAEKQAARAVARKSTATTTSRQDSQSSTTSSSQGAVKHLNNSTIFLEDDNRPKGKVVYYTTRKNLPPKSFVPHECKPSCLYTITHNLHSYSPLAKPLLSGWERQIFKSKLKKSVVYRAPCGRRIRNMEELHRYLRLTKNVLNVDNFDFDCAIHCLAEYVIDSSIVSKPDISNGIENMVIPCVNYYDSTFPPYCEYSLQRIPTEGVKMNLDTAFLAGCDCEDDCLDKSKCSCWQLTLAGARFGNPNTPPENVGYSFKRLLEQVPTGIYECNANCKCSKNCLNRVVQNPLEVKLQLFKTSSRGWGLRCLNDIPKGTFICIYAGHLLTEQKANEGGVNASDEYFAELDYIEVVERLKEGYESDVQEENESEDEDIETSTHSEENIFEDLEMSDMLTQEAIVQPTQGRKRHSSASDTKRSSTHQSPDTLPSTSSDFKTELREMTVRALGNISANVRVNDEFSAFGDYIASELRSLNADQAKFAKRKLARVFNDVIDEALSMEPNPDADSDEDFRSKCSVEKDGSINTRLRTRRSTTDDDKKRKKKSGDEDSEERQVINFEPNTSLGNEEQTALNTKYKSIRKYFGKNEFCYVMDAKKTGNIGRYFNHSCSPNLFVQNVFVDTQDLRFPWVAFFALSHIRAGTELTWNYNYEEPNPDADSDEDFRSKCSVEKDGSINTRLRTRRSTTDDDKKRKKKSGDEDSEERQVINFEPNTSLGNEEQTALNTKYKSIRKYFGKNEFCYVMDAKKTGNIGRYFNHSCLPNLFVQNVFVDTQDLRFPWVAFFALSHIRAGTELTWNYNYEVGIVPGKVLYCECGAPNCRGRLL